MSGRAITKHAQFRACPACERRFVLAEARPLASAPRCTCGAALVEVALPSGLYEITHEAAASAPKTHAWHEPDLGYGESHGYGPSHGGPTSPGDAPAPANDEGEERPRRVGG